MVAGFAAEVRGAVEVVRLSDKGVDWKKRSQGASLVLAIGPAAAAQARRALASVPMLFCMVPHYERYGLEGPKATGIALSVPVADELRALKAMAPELKSLGVVHDPRFSGKPVEEASAAAADVGLTLVPIEVESASRVERAVKAAQGKVEGLLLVADKTVGTASVVRALLETAAQQKWPVVALSPSQVREGALLALSPSPVAIGQQAGQLANRVLFEKVDPGALAVSPPAGLELTVSTSAARRLSLSAEWPVRLMQHAAKQGYVVRPVE